MNLTKYKNQENPTRGNKVILSNLEFTNFGFIKLGTEIYYNIVIKDYPQYNYILKNGKGYLFTTDKHGNPKKPSTFYIESLISLEETVLRNAIRSTTTLNNKIVLEQRLERFLNKVK